MGCSCFQACTFGQFGGRNKRIDQTRLSGVCFTLGKMHAQKLSWSQVLYQATQMVSSRMTHIDRCFHSANFIEVIRVHTASELRRMG